MELLTYFFPLLFLSINRCSCNYFLLVDFFPDQFLFNFFSFCNVDKSGNHVQKLTLVIIYRLGAGEYPSKLFAVLSTHTQYSIFYGLSFPGCDQSRMLFFW